MRVRQNRRIKRRKARRSQLETPGGKGLNKTPVVFSCIFCFWQMKNVNCPVCIWEFLHYSSASLVPAAPSPWQLPAPCSQHTHMHAHTPTHTLTPFFRLCRRNGLDDWLTPWPLRPWCVSMRLCVCVCMVHWYSRDIQCTRMPAVCPRGVSCWWQNTFSLSLSLSLSRSLSRSLTPSFVPRLFLSWPGCTLPSPGM